MEGGHSPSSDHSSILLERPFMRTARANIYDGTLMEFDGDKTFSIFFIP